MTMSSWGKLYGRGREVVKVAWVWRGKFDGGGGNQDLQEEGRGGNRDRKGDSNPVIYVHK